MKKSHKSYVMLNFELKAQKIKNKRLENRISDLEKKLDSKNNISSTFEKASPEVSIERYENYLKYKYNLIKSTDVWNVTGRIFAYSRRSLFIARLFKYASLIIAFIETSAVFLLTATVLLIIIPSALVLALILMIVDTIAGRKYNDKILSQIKGKKILFLIAQKGYKKERGSYFDRLASDYAKDGRYYVIVISKSLRDGLFLTARFNEERLVVIRETYFFRLKRALIKANIKNENVIIVH